MTVDEKVRERVIDVLNRLSEGYSKRDIDGIIALMDLGLMGFGTGADERVSGVEEFRSRLERDLSQCDEMSLYYSNVDVDGEGAVAWLACDCRAVVVVRGISQEIKFRLTAVLRLEKVSVRFAQLHFSLPAEGQVDGESFPSMDASKPRPTISVRPDLTSERFTPGA